MDAPAEALKACCARVYSADAVAWLLGGSLHPGGVALTRRLGQLLNLGPSARVLDVAVGRGQGAQTLAQEAGCQVVGVDLQVPVGQDGPVALLRGDAEALPIQGHAFDAIVCECSLCLFPDKPAALAEMYRVLRPGGRIGIADLTVEPGALPPELQGLAAYVACVATALPRDDLQALVRRAGFADVHWEEHREALVEFIAGIQGRLAMVKAAVGLGKLPLPLDTDLDGALQLARRAQELVREGKVSYGILTATKPTST